MSTCPKCGNTKIYGPRYVVGGKGLEQLKYLCSRCGYAEYHPTLDSGENRTNA